MKKKQHHSYKLSNLAQNALDSTWFYYVAPLVLLGGWLLYAYIKGDIKAPDAYFLNVYLFNYDGGFISRGLVGEVISWFTDTVSDELIENIILGFCIAYIVAFSLFIGKQFNKIKYDKEKLSWILVVVLIIAILPFSFDQQFADYKAEKLLWALTWLSVFLSDRKYGILLVPFLCVIATLINTKFLLISMVLIAIILLQEFYNNKYSIKNGIVCALSYIPMIIIGIFANSWQRNHSFSNSKEMIDHFFSRYTGEISDRTYELFVGRWSYEFFYTPFDAMIELHQMYLKDNAHMLYTVIISLVFVAVPLFIFTFRFWFKVLKNEENKFQKLIYFFCAVIPVTAVAGSAMVWEPPTYITYNMMMQCCLMVYFIANNHEAVIKAIHQYIDYFKTHYLIAIAGLIYFISFCAR